jgi:DNA replication protein DnaC
MMTAEEVQALIWRELDDENTIPCPHCGGMGYLTVAVPPGHELFGHAFKCVCQRSEALARTVATALKGATESIPQAAYYFDWKDFANLPHAQAALAAARALVCGPEKPGLVIWGSTGTGKTTLALLALRYVAGAGLNVAWVEYTDLIKRVQSTYDRQNYEGPSEDEIITALTKADLLVLDDLGSVASDRPASENRTEIIFRVINGRYVWGGRTIITTNLSPEHLRRQFGDRVYSRVAGMSALVRCDGKDLRQ